MADACTVRNAAKHVVQALQSRGHTAYFAGGCVRDELLKLTPTDYDVATDARPDDIRGIFGRVSEVGAAFGVTLVHTKRRTIEVATFREEGAYSDRRRPDSVHFTDAEHDAKRRDFTINALFLDPLDDTGEAQSEAPHVRGRVYDFVGGLEDLSCGIVRAVGEPDERLAEDHLRALRGVRFAARLGFRLDEATAAAIRHRARHLAGVSRERIGHELRRMLADAGRAEATAMMEQLALAAPALGDNVEHAGAVDAQSSTPTVERLGEQADCVTALAAWSLDRMASRANRTPDADQINAERDRLTRQLRSALCLTNDESASFGQTFRIVAVLEKEWASMGLAAQKRLAVEPRFDQAMLLAQARSPDLIEAVQGRIRELEATPSGLEPSPAITGDDLVTMGLTPGPRFAGLLEEVYDAQLEGRITGREEAIEHIKRALGL